MSDPTPPDKPVQKFPQLAVNPELLKPYAPAEPAQPIDQLMEEARKRGASRMIIEGTQGKDVTDAQVKAVVAQVNAYKLKNPRVTLGQVARATGYSNSVISQFLGAKYKGDVQQVAIDLDRWLEAEQKRDAAPRTSDFVWTGVAREILTVAQTAVRTRRIGLVYGPETSGIGKTLSLKAVSLELSGALMITVRKTSASMRGILESICEAMTPKLKCDGNNDALFKRIADKLRDTPRLLIVDQIHNLCGTVKDKPFYVLADLHDETNAPQLWAGTKDIVAYLDRGQARGEEPLAQIRSRIVIARDLMERTLPKSHGGKGEPLFSIDEVRRVFAKNKIRLAPDAQDYLCKLANLPNAGALRTCVDLVDITTTVAEAEGAKLITAEMLRSFHRGLRNWRAFEILEGKLADETRRPMPAAKVG